MEGGYRGHDGIRRWWAGLLGTFPDFSVEVRDVEDLGDVTIAALHMRGHAAESDTPVDSAAWYGIQFRHGKCVGWYAYTSKQEALERARLQE